MFYKAIFSLSINRNKASLFKKRLCVFFIFGCMMVNGFAPNKGEEKKYSLIMLFADISQNAAVQLLGKYGNSIMSVASKICTEITKKMLPTGSEPVSSSKESNDQENTSSDYAVINSALNMNKRLALSEEESRSGQTLFLALGAERLFKGYSCCKSGLEGALGVVILFLIFVIAIRQRKGRGEEIILLINKIEKKIRISA